MGEYFPNHSGQHALLAFLFGGFTLNISLKMVSGRTTFEPLLK